jgi:O-6-methylguanine DNA methyltransferase
MHQKCNRGAPQAARITASQAFSCCGADPLLLDWLSSYAKGIHLPFPLPLHGTPFQRKVWEEMQKIPFGETVSYKELAIRCGSGARAIGGACHRNPFLLIVPCHRVIQTNGSLGGFAAGLPIKEQLLDFEKNYKN